MRQEIIGSQEPTPMSLGSFLRQPIGDGPIKILGKIIGRL